MSTHTPYGSPCIECGGTGQKLSIIGPDRLARTDPCPTCGGTGFTGERPILDTFREIVETSDGDVVGGWVKTNWTALFKALSSTSESKDATRWQFCMKNGFPKACFNPEREVHYFYVRADCCDDTAFGWDTPEKAVDATMQIIKERDEANDRWRQETRT